MGLSGHKVAPALLVAMMTTATGAHETDQFTVPLGKTFADMSGWLGTLIYETLEGAIETTNAGIRDAIESGRDRDHVEQLQAPRMLAKEVFKEFPAAFFLIESLENHLHYGPTKREHPGRLVGYRETTKNIYRNVHFPLDPRQLFRIWHASTMKVHGSYFGPDKVGHFTDMGYQYYVVYRRTLAGGATETEAIEAAVRVGTQGLLFAEQGMVGFLSAGAYSNADLAANYIGLKFYCNLTEPVMLEGELRPPLARLEGEYWRLAPHVRRDSGFFRWFVSDHLNEALNPSFFEPAMRPAVHEAVRSRADSLLEWYADDNGVRRRREHFEGMIETLRTYWGEDYGHRGEQDELVSIANGCFVTPPETWTPNVRSSNGYTTLHWAAHLGATDRAEALSAAGADVDAPLFSPAVANSDWGSTPLHLAAATGAVGVVEALLRHGADPGAQAVNGATPLHRAIGHPETVRALLEAGADPGSRDEQGRTPLHWLARYPVTASIELLLAAGASATPADHDGRTPLHRAARWGHLGVIRSLLAAGADIEARSDLGLTPAHAAAAAGQTEAIALLVSVGADPDAADDFGLTPLHEAARRGHAAVVSRLVELGANPDTPDHYGSRPLHNAAREGRERVVEILIAANANPNAANAFGSTPLHEAVAAGRAPMLHLLVGLGANPSARDRHGKTALELARWDRSRELAILKLAGNSGGVYALPMATDTP